MEANVLPGGLFINSELRRNYRFKPLTGKIEREIQDSGEKSASLAEQVSEILTGTLDTLADKPADRSVVDALCTGDRQYLILKLHGMINPDPSWVTCRCTVCNEKMQFLLDYHQLPVKEAGDRYPQTEIELNDTVYVLRVPNGEDEISLSYQSTNKESLKLSVVKQLLISLDGNDNAELNDDDIKCLDEILDDMSPQVTPYMQVVCPYCESCQKISIDHYDWITGFKELDREIHTLASHYHWSENDILSLSRTRRKRYLSMIDRSDVKSNGNHKYTRNNIGGAI